MALVDDYRKHAQEPRATAELVTTRRDKTMWLNMAEEWDRMAEKEAMDGNQARQLAHQPGAVPPRKDNP